MKPSTSYLVCASQRSGTTLLCRALADTGVAGRPDEYFLAVDERDHAEWRGWEHGPFGRAHQARDREHYLDIVSDLGSTPNGVFGAKLMWNNLPWATAKFQEMPRFSGLDRADVLHAAFPNLHVVHMTRRDRVRQAVSWARMAQDGVWVVSDDEPARTSATPRYDFDLISDLEALIVEGEQGWRDLFDELGLVPYEVGYEDVVADGGLERAFSACSTTSGSTAAASTSPARAPTDSRTTSTRRGWRATPTSARRLWERRDARKPGLRAVVGPHHGFRTRLLPGTGSLHNDRDAHGQQQEHHDHTAGA